MLSPIITGDKEVLASRKRASEARPYKKAFSRSSSDLAEERRLRYNRKVPIAGLDIAGEVTLEPLSLEISTNAKTRRTYNSSLLPGLLNSVADPMVT